MAKQLYSPKMYEYVIVQVKTEKKKKQQSLFEQKEELTIQIQQPVYKIVGFSAKDGTFQLEADPIEDPSMKFLASKSSWTKANQLKPAPAGHRTWTDADVRKLWKSA